MSTRITEERGENSVPQTTELGLGKVTYPEVEETPSRAPSRPRAGKGLKPRTKVILALVAAVALIALIVGGIAWSKRGVVAVQTGKVVRQDLSSIVTASGQIKPKKENQANVNANSFGKIVEIRVQEGDKVTKGELLLRTEAVQQTATVEATQAAVKTAQADLDGSQAAVLSSAAALKTAQADLQTAQANLTRAQDDFKRAQELLNDKLIAQQDFDQRLNNFKVAQASAEGAQARVAQSKALYQQAIYNRDMAKARLAQQRANLLGAEDARNKTEYFSPLTGIITSLPVHLGENVVPGIQNTAGSLLYTVSNLSVMTAEVKVDETDIPNVKLDQGADVTIDAYPNKTFKGKVTEIGQSAVGRTSGQTTSTSVSTPDEAKDFIVVVTLENPPAGLRPGLSATAKITTATRKDAVTVPIQALTIRTRGELETPAPGSKGKALAAKPETEADRRAREAKAKEEVQGLFTVKDGVAKFAPVTTGIMGTTDVEVLSGVKPGDTIVTGSYKALRTLRNNTKVKVDNTPLGPTGGAGASS
jgi:HlyD family secretion protein